MTKSVKFASNDDPGKPCVFPFTSGNVVYNECTISDWISGPWCATEVDTNGLAVAYKYGFCNTACPGGVFLGPSDVGGTCTTGSSLITKDDTAAVDHCCCGTADCCWARCTLNTPPESCLPPGAEWNKSDNLGYFQATTPISCEAELGFHYPGEEENYPGPNPKKDDVESCRSYCRLLGAGYFIWRGPNWSGNAELQLNCRCKISLPAEKKISKTGVYSGTTVLCTPVTTT